MRGCVLLVMVILVMGLVRGADAQDFSDTSLLPPSSPSQGSSETGESMRDPFAAGISEVPAQGSGPTPFLPSAGPVLQGIAIGSSGKAFAVINGVKYIEGESRNGLEVLEIQKKEVRVRIGGEEKVLSMALQFEKSASKESVQERPAPKAPDTHPSVSSKNTVSSYPNSDSSMALSQGGTL